MIRMCRILFLVMVFLIMMGSTTVMVEKAKRSYHDEHIDTEELCRNNITAKAGMVARLFCCIAVHDRDIGVRTKTNRHFLWGRGQKKCTKFSGQIIKRGGPKTTKHNNPSFCYGSCNDSNAKTKLQNKTSLKHS